MNTYYVNATLIVPAWVEVEAEDEEEAAIRGALARPQDFDTDMAAANIIFDVTPKVTLAP